MKYAIGIDIGGTTIKAGLVNSKGKILKKSEHVTPKKNNKEFLNMIKKAIDEVKTKKIEGIGMGSPGPLDHKKGIIKDPVNLHVKNLAIVSLLKKYYKKPVFLDNDANCFALAQAVFGQAKRYNNVVGITLGTGFGTGIIINNELYHGRGNAGETGHETINFDGPKATCGNNGCIETYIGTSGIKKSYDNKTMPKEIFLKAKQGNAKAKKTFKTMGKQLGVGLANIMYSFDPDCIVIGGKVRHSWPYFSKTMKQEIQKRYFSKPCPVLRSTLIDAGIIGAAALVMQY